MSVRILVVDDEKHICTLIQTALSSNGHIIDTAGDFDSAVALLEKNEYIAVLTEKNYPGQGENQEGGIDLLRHVKERYPGIEVILMTGYASTESAIEAVRLGAFDYIQKPFKVEELREKIDAVVEYQLSSGIEFISPTLNDLLGTMERIVESSDSLSQQQKQEATAELREKLDTCILAMKKQERILYLQRAALDTVQSLVKQLQEKTPDSHPFFSTLEEIAEEACKRL